MRIAVIDVGTNTSNLLVASLENGLNTVFEYQQVSTVNLRKKAILSDVIENESLENLKQVLDFQKTLSLNHRVEKIYIVATSAIRNCVTGKQFLQQWALENDCFCQIIDGNTEAVLIWRGITHQLPRKENIVLGLDIGGGSCEWMIGDGKKLIWKTSIEMGMARVLQKFGTPSKPDLAFLNAVKLYFEVEMVSVFEAVNLLKPKIFIGASGSFETLSAMNGTPISLMHPISKINASNWDKLLHLIIENDSGFRSSLSGMIPIRTDMIVPACILIDLMVKRFFFDGFYSTAYALKEGYALCHLHSYG